jgi:pimeloyl-ACP methyl ester carboxylesterase
MKTFSVKGPNGILGGVETGGGPPLVLVAGLGSTYRLWGELPKLLGRLFTVVAFDNRGVGRSRGGEPFSLISAADDLVTIIDERCGGRAAVLGASMGGAIALHAAVRSPGRIQTAVVVSSAAHLGHHGRRMLELLADLMDHTAPDRIGHHLMSLAFAPPFHENHAGFVRDAEKLYELGLEDIPGARAQVRHLLEGWDLRTSLRSTSTPTLVVAGRRDPLVAFEDSELIAHLMPNGRLLPVEDAGHSVLAEGGGPVLDTIVAFLTSGERHPPQPEAV